MIWILRGNKKIQEEILRLSYETSLSISVISIAEIYKNIFPAELTVTEDFLEEFVIFEVDQKMAKVAGLYWQQYSKNLRNLSLADCLIAATANVNNATLVTLNTKHFPMKDVEVINPIN